MTFFVDAQSVFYLAAIFKVCCQMGRGLEMGLLAGLEQSEFSEYPIACWRQNSNGYHENTPHPPAHRQRK